MAVHLPQDTWRFPHLLLALLLQLLLCAVRFCLCCSCSSLGCLQLLLQLSNLRLSG
jgi:hypothetical protein